MNGIVSPAEKAMFLRAKTPTSAGGSEMASPAYDARRAGDDVDAHPVAEDARAG